jgi:hypothetical protein
MATQGSVGAGALRLPRVAVALGLQLLAALLVAGVVRALGVASPPWAIASAIGLLAALAAWALRLEWWWVVIQIVLPLAALALLRADLPPWLFLALLLVLGLFYWSTVRTRVPLYLSNRRTWDAVAALLPPARPGVTANLVDLGCGLGGLIVHLARLRPDMSFVGMELAPLPAAWCKLRLLASGLSNARVEWRSFWPQNLAAYDVVFAFLSPVPMPRLWEKAQREMRPGSLFVSCEFPVAGQEPRQIVELDQARQSRLYVWRMPDAS